MIHITDEVKSKVAVVVSLNRRFWLINVGLPTKYCILTNVNKPELSTPTHESRQPKFYV